MTVTPDGEKPQTFKGLPCEKDFTELSWFGFSTPGTEAGVCFLDDLTLELK